MQCLSGVRISAPVVDFEHKEPRRANASAAVLYATQNDYLNSTHTPKSFQLSIRESKPPFFSVVSMEMIVY